MIERMPLSIDFGNTFILILLNISNIELKKDSNIDKLKNFNTNLQIHLTLKGEHKEFTVIKINLNITKKNDEKHLYNENNLYFEFNNTGHYNIIQINYIYNYCTLHLKLKAINNFFLKTMFKLIKKVCREEETKHWTFIIKITIYRIFILSSEYPSIYIKEEATLERY